MTAITLGEKMESSGCLRALKMSWADSTGWGLESAKVCMQDFKKIQKNACHYSVSARSIHRGVKRTCLNLGKFAGARAADFPLFAKH
jgi:hypothetical protein